MFTVKALFTENRNIIGLFGTTVEPEISTLSTRPEPNKQFSLTRPEAEVEKN